jgi:hypothetical protein
MQEWYHTLCGLTTQPELKGERRGNISYSTGAPDRNVDGSRPVGAPVGRAQDALRSRAGRDRPRTVAECLLALYNTGIIPLTFPSSGRYPQRGD